MNRASFEALLKESGSAKIVAVSKSVDFPAVAALASLGQLDFGENKVQELQRKIIGLGDDFRGLKWHFIGRLQSNKINALLALRPTLWHSCESVAAAAAVDKRLEYDLPALLQINSANEASKQGVDSERAVDDYCQILESSRHLKLVGVMSIGAHTDELSVIKASFETTYKIFEKLQSKGAKICSMGMSDDWQLALKCGSNMLRLGRMMWL